MSSENSAALRPRILIVDDAPENLRILQNLLSNQGEIYIARNGRVALDQTERIRLDIILLDINMPQLDGYEVCRQLKSDPKTREIPVIFVTGNDSKENETVGLEIGAIDYITKPFSACWPN